MKAVVCQFNKILPPWLSSFWLPISSLIYSKNVPLDIVMVQKWTIKDQPEIFWTFTLDIERDKLFSLGLQSVDIPKSPITGGNPSTVKIWLIHCIFLALESCYARGQIQPMKVHYFLFDLCNSEFGFCSCNRKYPV